MRLFLLLLLFLAPVHGQITTLVTVGDIPITSFDVDEMRAFMEATGVPKPTSAQAMETLMENAVLLSIAEGNPDLVMNENEMRRMLNNITNTSAQAGAEERRKVYERFPDTFRMAIRADKVRRGLVFADPKIRVEVTVPSSEAERRDFYRKNRAQMMDSPFPKINLIVFAAEVDDRMTLSEITALEENLQALSDDLTKSTNLAALRRKYNRIKFTRYSGEETGLFTPDILILQKRIPEEILGASLQKNLDLGSLKIDIMRNKGIFIPVPVPVRATQKATYFVFKVLEIVQPRQLAFEEASSRIDDLIRQERGEKAVKELLRNRIRDGQVTITVGQAGRLSPVIDRFAAGQPS